MKKGMVMTISIIAIIAIMIVWVINVYNNMVTAEETVTTEWANVECYY